MEPNVTKSNMIDPKQEKYVEIASAMPPRDKVTTSLGSISRKSFSKVAASLSQLSKDVFTNENEKAIISKKALEAARSLESVNVKDDNDVLDEDLLKYLNTEPMKGLTSAEVTERIAIFGKNGIFD